MSEEYNDIYEEAYKAYRHYGSYAKAGAHLQCDYRTIKRRIETYFRHPEHAVLERESARTRTNPDNVSHYWLKTKNKEGDNVSLLVKNQVDISFEEMREYLIESLKIHSPSYERIHYDETGENLLVIDPADIHIGKLGVTTETGDTEYNIDSAVKKAKEGVLQVVERARPFGIKDIVFVIGNDIIHIDKPHRTTTANTPQDTDGQWWQMFIAAKDLYVEIIEYLTTIANVTVVFCPSNHDYVTGFMLADTVFSWFRNNPNVSFGKDQANISINHRKYIQYGNNLIGFSHGDGAKEKDLPFLMQYEARQAWGQTKFAYWYLHHIHHKVRTSHGSNNQRLEKDHVGVTVLNANKDSNPETNVYVEYLRTPSSNDGWHARNGYVNKQAIEAFIHHPEQGQICRFTHFFD